MEVLFLPNSNNRLGILKRHDTTSYVRVKRHNFSYIYPSPYPEGL